MKKLPIPRWLVIAIAVLPAVIAVGIFAFIARFAIAHDESRCPFHEVETRQAEGGAVEVREEARRCIDEVEEHRWIAVRGARELELGRFPLEAAQIERGFPWSIELEEGRAVVTVINEGRGEIVFREPAPE